MFFFVFVCFCVLVFFFLVSLHSNYKHAAEFHGLSKIMVAWRRPKYVKKKKIGKHTNLFPGYFYSLYQSTHTLYTSCTVVSLSNCRYIVFNMRTIWIGSHWAQMLVKVTTSLNSMVHSLNSPVSRKNSCKYW